jgi:protein TonB
MFGDTLLESSSVARKNKRWPMATAFTVEAIVAAIVVIVPLLSTGVIPISARPPLYTPIKPVTLEPPVERVRPDRAAASEQARPATRSAEVVPFSDNNRGKIFIGHPAYPAVNPPGIGEGGPDETSNNFPDDLARVGNGNPNVKSGGPTRVISQLTEAQLLRRVEPIYPHIASVSGIQGQVKLHAIIARDGSIQSLNAVSGHPLLVRAALEAVEQWRYRPYVLNGEKVEVETFITVNFRRDFH